MGGLYDILESYRQQNDPRFIYDGLYQDPLYNIATANPLKAMSPGYEYRNSDAINRYLKSGAYDMSGNVPADYDRAIDFKRYFEDRPLKTLDYGNRFQDFKPRVGFPNTSVFGITPENFSTTGIMQKAPLQNLGIDTSYGVANEEDVEQEFLPDQKKSSGLADLFRTLIGFAVPGANFFLNQGRGALDGIKSLNQRLRNTDFAKSNTLADYFDARSYGGRDARDRKAQKTMREARGIQRQVDMRPSAVPTNQDRGRGQNFSGPTRSAAATRSRDLGSMRGGVGR
ncbi:hypothetical protein HTVC027P_gp76 [Pelagibacter phage HTVC027P]|nr:hypothetical protein HTVC027P_gp76 [Pelagibacter phage HTVC027P]